MPEGGVVGGSGTHKSVRQKQPTDIFLLVNFGSPQKKFWSGAGGSQVWTHPYAPAAPAFTAISVRFKFIQCG